MLELLLALPPGQPISPSPGLTLVHMAYRIGPGPKLFGVRMAPPPQGGLMMADCRGFDGQGDPAGCCRQILGECKRRNFRGVVCDFDSPPLGCLPRLVDMLGRNCAQQDLALYVPEAFASFSPAARVLIPSSLTSGTLERRLQTAISQYGAQRVALAVEWTREDFPLPAAGRGDPISREALEEQIRRLEPAGFFDRGLCAHYYTYMAAGGQAHFVLFDTPRSIREKLNVAERLRLAAALLPGPEVAGCLEEICPPS